MNTRSKIIKKFIICLLFAITISSGVTSVVAETVLITGANSGIGLEFSKQYAAKGWTVYATHRRDQIPDSLKVLSDKFKNVKVERMDVTKHDEIDALAAKLKDTPIDILINNAGIVILSKFAGIGNNIDQKLGSLNYDHFDTIMEVNVKGPIKVSEAFVEHVKASKEKKIIAISSAAAMLSSTPRGAGLYWYGTSKAALNKVMVSLSADLKDDGVVVAMFHPGGVRVEKFAKLDYPGMLETDYAVGNMIKTIDGLTIADTGKFMRNNGEQHPW